MPGENFLIVTVITMLLLDCYVDSILITNKVRTFILGCIRYKGAKIQLLDLPGIIEGAKDGKGRGRQVIAVARTASLIFIGKLL